MTAAATHLHDMLVTGVYRVEDLVLLFGDTYAGRMGFTLAVTNMDAAGFAAARTADNYRAEPVLSNIDSTTGRPSDGLLVVPLARTTLPQGVPVGAPVAVMPPTWFVVELDGPDTDADAGAPATPTPTEGGE